MGVEAPGDHDGGGGQAGRAMIPSLGEIPTMIGRLLAHRMVQLTARYGRLARDLVKAAGRPVSTSLVVVMNIANNLSGEATCAFVSFPESSPSN